ncbi:hypothetical protein ABC974_26540, partial [Sphingomonas oligophenolica]
MSDILFFLRHLGLVPGSIDPRRTDAAALAATWMPEQVPLLSGILSVGVGARQTNPEDSAKIVLSRHGFGR